jgi:hypothetical protein
VFGFGVCPLFLAMATSVFTQVVTDDGGAMDYEIPTSKTSTFSTGAMSSTDTPTHPKFNVIHDVARPVRHFVISSSKSMLAKPVELCPMQ